MKNLKRRFWYLILLSCLPFLNLSAQNLVPNYSFEDTVACPFNEDQIDFAVGWSKFSPPNSTPDYYNSCAPPGTLSVPSSYYCYQSAYSGNAYAAVITFSTFTIPYREIIGVQLNQNLIIGTQYYLSFFVSMCNGDASFTPSNNIGAKLTTQFYDPTSPIAIDNSAHVYSSAIINDSINWVKISGSIVADSNYQYLALGNFFDDLNTDTIKFSNSSISSYYLIDHLCLSPDSTFCDQLTSTNTNGSIEQNPFSISPNPATDYITITTPTAGDLKIYDTAGRLVLMKQNVTDKEILNTSGFAPGPYNATLSRKEKVEHCRFVITSIF